MDVFAIRYENLRLLVHELRRRHPTWLQRDVATALDVSPSFLSQLTAGKKMGDEVARKIEVARNLPHGWMDVLQTEPSRVGEPPPPYVTSRPLRIDPETIAAALRLVRLSFQNLDLEIDQEVNGLPLAVAYDFLMERKEHEVTADNLLEFKPRLTKAMGVLHAQQEEGGDRGSRASTG